MVEAKAEFWNPVYNFRMWRDLDGTIDDLIGAYGLSSVRKSLSRHEARGREPQFDDKELRIFVGRLDGMHHALGTTKASGTRMKAQWGSKFPEHRRGAAEKHAERVLKNRKVLGLTFAIGEFWSEMDERARRRVLREVATAEVELHPWIRDIAAALAIGPASDLDERPPSRGMVPDPIGLPRLNRKLQAIVDELLVPAFKYGALRQK